MSSTLVRMMILSGALVGLLPPAFALPPFRGVNPVRNSTDLAIKQEGADEKLARRIFQAPGRVDFLPPSKPLKLAEENEVALQIHSTGLSKLEVQQVQYSPRDTGHRTPVLLRRGWAMLPVFYHADGSAYVKVTPQALGQVVLKVVAEFPDGGETHAEGLISVGSPDRSPSKLFVGDPGMTRSIPMMNIYLKPDPGYLVPAVEAVYGDDGERYQINPAFVSFKIRTANNAPVIELDKATALIKPVQKGEAILETTFQGWSNPTCILVEEEFDPNRRAKSHCESLLQPGEKLATPIREENPR